MKIVGHVGKSSFCCWASEESVTRHQGSHGQGTEALQLYQAGAPNKDPGFLKKNPVIFKGYVSFREGNAPKTTSTARFVCCEVGLNKKNTVVTGCLMMDLF